MNAEEAVAQFAHMLPDSEEARNTVTEIIEKAVANALAVRRHLPDERNSITHKFRVEGHKGYVIVGLFEDGSPGELFIKMSKQGSTLSGMADSFATMTSLALQWGVPIKQLCKKFVGVRFVPQGYTGNPEIPEATSITDYIFRWLALKFLTEKERTEIGIKAATS
ncbi:MAG: hypothetical protein IH991_12800 [Planctomycetes bacterium]|nr:hypothetical protein [Planctomycetota bacterium]